MRYRALLAVLPFLLLPSHSAAQTLRWLYWTNPSNEVRMAWAVDPETGDSTLGRVCGESGDPLRDLATIRIWRWPATGGQPYIFAELDELGREGLPDSIQVPEGAHYFTTSMDTTGRNESCPSAIIYLGSPTSVDVGTAGEGPSSILIFDVRGRLLRRMAGEAAAALWKGAPPAPGPGAHALIRRAAADLVAGLPSGLYLYRVRWPSGAVASGKLPPIVR